MLLSLQQAEIILVKTKPSPQVRLADSKNTEIDDLREKLIEPATLVNYFFSNDEKLPDPLAVWGLDWSHIGVVSNQAPPHKYSDAYSSSLWSVQSSISPPASASPTRSLSFSWSPPLLHSLHHHTITPSWIITWFSPSLIFKPFLQTSSPTTTKSDQWALVNVN